MSSDITELELLREENQKLKQLIESGNRNNIGATEEKYQTLFTELKDTIYESTPEGKLIDINPAGIELFGYSSKEEILKVDIARDLYINPEERTKLLAQFEKNGFIKDYEIRIKDKAGNEKTVLETSFLLKDVNGNLIGYQGILRDVTEHKRDEILLRKYNEELSEVNRQLKNSEDELKKINSEKDKFFSIIAHDLKSPFNALLNLSEFLVEDLSDLSFAEIKTFSGEINKSAHSVYDLLLNLLQWAQIKTGRMGITKEKVPLSGIINNTMVLLKNVANKKSIKLVNETEDSLFFKGDKTMISSVLQNLISNAIKFSKRNGEIIIFSEVKEGEIIVSVVDNGVGIPQDNLNRLFKLDEHVSTQGTANEAGTGLGLILCKELVEKNNGKIWVQSEERIGTTFSFSLPLA